MLRRQPRWLKGIQVELDALLAKANRAAIADILATYLPTLDAQFIDDCLASLRPACSRWQRLLVRRELQDRKSTRLNSSHGYISYAVFCLKKKTNNIRYSI